jgi:hypothetical protein
LDPFFIPHAFSHTIVKENRKSNTEKKTPNRKTRLRSLTILLERTEEGVLLLRGLETTVTELGGGVDPLELDLLERLAGSVGEERFPQGHHTLLDTRNRALNDDEVVLDLTIPGEATHRSLSET